MEPLGGLSEFFYNIVPGILFLLVLDSIYHFDIISANTIDGLFWVVIFGLALGFAGQGIVKILRKCLGINESIFCNVRCSDNEMYDIALDKLQGITKKKKEITTQDAFYMMDNYLRNTSTSYVINHFAEKVAFWANMTLGSFVSLLLFIFTNETDKIFFSLISFLLSFRFFYINSISEYQSVIQTFVLDTMKNKKKL